MIKLTFKFHPYPHSEKVKWDSDERFPSTFSTASSFFTYDSATFSCHFIVVFLLWLCSFLRFPFATVVIYFREPRKLADQQIIYLGYLTSPWPLAFPTVIVLLNMGRHNDHYSLGQCGVIVSVLARSTFTQHLSNHNTELSILLW